MNRRSLKFAFCRKYFILFVISYLGYEVSAQRLQFVIDSVKTELSAATTDDGRAYQHMVLAAIYSRNDSINTVKHALEGVRYADMAGNQLYKLGSLNYIGVMISKLGHYDASTRFLDSLANLAKEVELPAIEADAYNNISFNYIQKGDWRNALRYELLALKIEIEIDDKNGISMGHGNMGEIYQSLGNNDSALYHFEQALEVRKEMGNARLTADSKLQLGNFHNTLGDFRLALDYFKQVEETYERLNHVIGMINIYNSYGVLFDYQGDYPKALDYYLKSVALREKHNLLEDLPGTLMNIGELYSKQEEYELALEYLNESLEKSEKVGFEGQIALTSSKIATIHHKRGDLERAMDFYLRSITLDESNENKRELASTYAQVAELQLDRENVTEAVQMINNALQINNETENRRSMAQNQLILGKVYLAQEQSAEAKVVIQKSIDQAKDMRLPTVVRDGAELLAQVESRLGDHKAAFEALTLFKKMDDSLRNTEDAKQIVRLQSEFEFDQEKLQIAAENERNLLVRDQELQRQQLIIIIGVILVFAMVVVGILIARFRIRSKAQETQKLKEIGAFKEAMTGMIAHDLKNPLGVIMGTESEKPSTRNMARQMLSLVNNMLDVQKFEKAEVKLYLEGVDVSQLLYECVEQVRMLLNEKNINVKYEIEENTIVNADRELLTRVVINLLTNAIKYAPQNSTITLGSSIRQNQVLLSIVDQGRGIPQHQIDEIFGAYRQLDPRHSGVIGSTGLGLTFCKLALEAHDSTIEVSSAEGEGTSFSFRLTKSTQQQSSVVTNEERIFRVSKEDRRLILDLLPALRGLKIHQAMQMETLLEPVRDQSEATRQWVESILNAAYNGNEDHFRELVEGVEIDWSSMNSD